MFLGTDFVNVVERLTDLIGVLVGVANRIPFGDHPLNLEIFTIQRRLAWPLRKDDAHTSRSVNNLVGVANRSFRQTFMICFFGARRGMQIHRTFCFIRVPVSQTFSTVAEGDVAPLPLY